MFIKVSFCLFVINLESAPVIRMLFHFFILQYLKGIVLLLRKFLNYGIKYWNHWPGQQRKDNNF
jgi:hypothetical protein